MKKYLYILFIVVVFSTVSSQAQQYGNEWINYSQKYYRIFVAPGKDGIYRINYTTLANAGINLSTTNAKLFQIFGRGIEQYIYVSDSNGIFRKNDYIEFYGMHNDGWYDSTVFQKPQVQPNPNYSLFNDTAIYYLTISQGPPGKRMGIKTATNFSSYTPAAYINKISRVDYTSNYFYGYTDANEINDPKYLSSEGWFDPGFNLNSGTLTKSVPTQNAYPSGNATINFRMIGESNYSGTGQLPNHNISMNFAGINIADTALSGFYTLNYQRTVLNSSFGSSNTTFKFSTVYNPNNTTADNNTISYINIKYQHTLDLEGDSSFVMYVPPASPAINPNVNSYLNMSDFIAIPNDSILFYDLTNNNRIKVIKNGSNYQVLVPNGNGNEKKCFITSASKIHHVSSLEQVSFTDFTSSTIRNSNYLIVTHQSLIGGLYSGGALDYAAYRGSSAGVIIPLS